MTLSTVSSLGMVSFAEDNTKNTSVDKDEEEFLAQAKAVAIAEINTFKSAANTAIAEKAIEDIDNAETVADVSAIHQKALHDMSAADEAAAVNTAKETAIFDIINAAKAAGNTPAVQKIFADATARINAATEITVIHSITAEALEQINIIASRPVGAPLGESLDESACTVHSGEAHVYSYGVLMEKRTGSVRLRYRIRPEL